MRIPALFLLTICIAATCLAAPPNVVIIFADDLTPADTVLMQNQGVSAFVTEFGGPMSHTAILARSLGIRLGDTLTFDVAGQVISAPVTSLRSVAWDSFNINFFVVGTPALLILCRAADVVRPVVDSREFSSRTRAS